MDSIRKRFDKDNGLWHVDVYRVVRSAVELAPVWTEVAVHSEEAEADDCIADLVEWKGDQE